MQHKPGNERWRKRLDEVTAEIEEGRKGRRKKPEKRKPRMGFSWNV